MMKRKTIFYSTLTLSLLFVGANTYLIEKANSKVDREVRVANWEISGKDDLVKELPKPGVVTAEEESYIYFNDEFGSFKKFLVKEGEQVKSGTPLYEYEVTDQTQQKSVLESEVEQLEDEIDSIEDNIDDLESLESSLPSSSSDDKKIPIDASALQSEYEIKKEIAAKELEIDRLENQIDNLERQISDMESYETTLTVQSSVDGTIKDLSHAIDNPLITIASQSTIVATDLTEKEIVTVEENMSAVVQSDIEKKTQKGIVTSVATLPKNDPHLQTDSMYPVEVKIQDTENKLLPGHHVFLSIITEEVKGALVVPVTAIEKEGSSTYVWILTEKGTVEKRKVETGLQVNGQQQIKSGVKAGEYYIVYPGDIPALENGTPFVTGIDWNKIKLSELKKVDRPTVLENLLIGILERK
ncbi:efflux RND transporter periplasmic adaptor subunit [Rossellomorea aquimaris]|jgi:HlyD family secretion protein|uniref:efflux RND transporter periplasmic adaptor subunit n=1 Tax=Rossellomorea aquimaris TaxID=189382 RepID=UPI0011E9857D|nr:HlyD family efflux transporter periplasmic adaptor subunit [Rossellomorea aquimaris]TYS85211.1 HlyD family efflux transporter periplasmic adaptor subunit [Rossellomorea aquimaris]